MNDYNYPSSTVFASSSSYLTSSTIASISSTLPWQHSIGDMVSNVIQPIENKLSQWFWQGVSILPQNYFSKDITKVNYFDKSLWQGIFNERLESLKEQLVSELAKQQQFLQPQNDIVLAKIDKLKEQIVADLPQDKFLLEEQLIYLQGIVGKYMLSPQCYEKGLDHLKQVVANNEQYITTIEKARSVFRSELKKQPELLAECLQGDVLHLFQASPQNSLTPTALKKILSYYKPLMAHKSYVRHQNWLQECYNTQSLLLPPAIKRHATTDTLSNERKEENVTWNGSIRNLGKLLWEHAGKLITLGLATQVTVAQASGTNVTQQNSRLGIGLANRSNLLDTLERVNQTFTNDTTLDFKILPTPIESWSSTLVNKSTQDTIIFGNKDYTNNTEIFTLPINSSVNYEFDQYIEISRELQHKILCQFNKINDDLHALIEMFSTDKNDELLEAKSSQTVLSRVIRSSFPFSQRQECTVSKDNLVSLKDAVHDTLSNVETTQRESNCELNTANTDNCDELLKLIQCGVDHLKNGFIQTTQNNISSDELIKWKNAYNNLFQKYTKEIDNIKKSSSQIYQDKIDKLLTSMQKLSESVSDLQQRLDTTTVDLCAAKIGLGHIDKTYAMSKKVINYL